MFWIKARRVYSSIDNNDADIENYLKIMDEIQDAGYKGLTGRIQDIGHRFISQYTTTGKTLEIGFGRGRQSLFFKGNPDNYYPIEINTRYINQETWSHFKNAKIADAQKLPFEDDFFNTVVSLYTFEHIHNIEIVLMEIRRVLMKNGKLIVALPCEGGFLWNVGRELSTRKTFIKKYDINYDKIIAFEHVHDLKELRKILHDYFFTDKERFYPFHIKITDFNLIYCGVFIRKS